MQVEFKSHEPSSLGPHVDYDLNLNKSKEFITNIQKSILPGLGVKLLGSIQVGSKNYRSIVEISWRTPKDIYLGTCCFPVSLHQDHPQFCAELENRFSEYYKEVKSYWDTKDVKVLAEPYKGTVEKASNLATDQSFWWQE